MVKGNRTIPGINIQWPWSELIASGKKTIETRKYDIPEKLRGQPLALIETPGPRGKKEAGINKARIIAIVVFRKTYRYKNQKHWASEEPLHRVPAAEPRYRFKSGKPKWAWVVESVELLKRQKPAPKKRGIVFATSCKVT